VRWLFRVALGAALGLAAPAAYGQQDPRLRWRTLETPHFRVHFYQEMEPVARRVARVSEALVERLAGPLGWRQSQRTEVVLSDDTDDANGSATSLPFNTVRLYLTAPDDLSVLHQYDDWLVNLMTHEYTHILHTDNISGIPALVNAIIGKQWSPNQVQPRFILEGLAVFEETLHTRGGRLRSSMWDMYLRGDALAGSLLTLDQLCNGPNRWPHGNLWYLYGSYLMQFVADRYGADRLAALSREYGSMTVPWQLNRAARRTIGHGWEDLYDAWRADTVTRYQRQRDAITAEGLIEGAALTAQGEYVRNPRFLPDGTLLYESADGRSQQQLRSLPPSALAAGAPRAEPRSLAWTGNASGFAVVDADTLVVSDVAPYRHVHFYHDLHRWSLRRGDDGAVSLAERARLSQGWRAQQPDVSPDGDHVAYTVNHRGTTALFEMSLTERTPRAVFRPRRYEQVYAPRYAPDGRTVAFSWWRRGGRRDIALWHRETGEVELVTDDVALDLSPAWSPDGRYLLWSSDRTGVSNVYAREVATRRTWQVTNVLGGAFQPVVSPDGNTLVYVGYSARGFDLHRLDLRPEAWREPPVLPRDPLGRDDPSPHTEDDPDDLSLPVPHRVTDYNPWPTLYPRAWLAEYVTDGFGPQLAIRTQGADVVGRHSWNARLAVGLVRGDPQADVTYVYRGLRPTLRLRLYRGVDAGGGYRVSGQPVPWVAERWGGESEISASFPGVFERNTLALSYEAQWVRALGGLPPVAERADPNEAPPSIPFEGWTAGVRASWFFNRVQRFAYSVSAQQGVSAYLSVRVTDPLFGSATGAVDVSGAVAGYVPMPWSTDRRRHVLAMHLGAGLGISDRGERALFALGGFPPLTAQSMLDAFRFGAQQGGIALRGYPIQARVGSQYQLLNAEYRFPLWQTQRGLTSLPFFLQRVTGNAFADVGNANYGRFDPSRLAVGVGAELLCDLVLGYVVPFTLRIGYARGLSEGGTDQLYGLFSAPF